MIDISQIPVENHPTEKEKARGMVIKNVRSCGICGGGADMYNGAYVCQKNPNHLGDITLGLFSDHSYSTS